MYDDLVRAINDPDRPPKLIQSIGKRAGAQFIPGEERIEVDACLMDMCRMLGRDSLNGLAFLLGHELAHFYMRHESGGIPISEREQQKRDNITNSNVRGIESEADFFAGFYGRMAGYDPLKIAPETLQLFYDTYGFSDTLYGYPTLGARKFIAIGVYDRLNELIPVFEVANNLTLIRKYPYAQRCYDHIINEFPSRELLNNAGTAYALEALYSLDSRYLYPIDLDMDTRLRGMDRGTRSPDGNDTLRARKALDSARVRFQNAMRCDTTYSSAVINLATVYILQGEPAEAVKLIEDNINCTANDRTLIMAKTVSALANVVQGNIQQARNMLEDLLNAAKGNGLGELVQANIDIIESRSFSIPLKLGIGSENETIRGIRAIDTDVALLGQLSERIGERDSLVVNSREYYGCPIIFISQGEFWSHFISTCEGFDGVTSKKIMIGSRAEEVMREYGDAPRIVNTPQGKYYIYDYSKIMFLIGLDDRVLRWTIYAME